MLGTHDRKLGQGPTGTQGNREQMKSEKRERDRKTGT